MAEYPLIHWKEYYKIDIQNCSDDKSGVIKWLCPQGCSDYEIRIRNIGNNLLSYYNDDIDTNILYVLLPELDKLPASFTSNDKRQTNRTCELEVNYVEHYDNFKIERFKKFGHKCSMEIVQIYNHYEPEVRITPPYGWKINKKPFFQFKSIDNNNIEEDALYKPITAIHSQKIDYNISLKHDNILREKVDYKKSYRLKFELITKRDLNFTEFIPQIFAFISLLLVVVTFVSVNNIVKDMIPSIAMCVANFNVGVFGYFTYKKYVSIGYAFINNSKMNTCYIFGFILTTLCIIVILVLHYWFNRIF